MAKKLSIIIPTYNAEPYINQLLDCLAKQMTDEVEVIVVDDGSDKPFESTYPWAKVIRKQNGGASSARNVGLDTATGEYIAFIDADDLVNDKYIETILNKAKTEKFDYCYMSWKTLPEGIQIEVKLNSIDDKFPDYNLCVWNRIYKRTVIGKVRFNEKKLIAEDAEFIKAVKEEGRKKSFIPEFMYYYRTETPNSLTKRFQQGSLSTRRVVYYFPAVTKKMAYLIDEFKYLNDDSEIILMTNNNELPQLADYAMVCSPRRIHGTELRGFPTPLFIKVTMPVKAQVVIWTDKTFEIGGIETFIYNFCKQMSKYYDIVVLYRQMDRTQKIRVSEFARVVQNNENIKIQCDTLIVNRITDKTPKNIEYKKKVQMVHSCKWQADLVIPQDNDYMVAVSKAVAKSYTDFKPDHKVINNLTCPASRDRALILVSATRTGTNEKGQKRMIALSNLMKEKNIPFIWFCFCDNVIQGAHNICCLKPTLDITPYLKAADYLVQLSDHEGFCYSIVEAMEQGTPVLVTDLEVLPELGFVDGKTGYKIPFDITNDFDIGKIYTNQLKGKFKYEYNNESRIKQWREILGEGSPRKNLEIYQEPMLPVRALLTYTDLELNRKIEKGTVLDMRSERVYELMQKRFLELAL